MNFTKSILLIAVIANISSYSFASEENFHIYDSMERVVLDDIREKLIPEVGEGIHTFYKHYSYETAVEMLNDYLKMTKYGSEFAEYFLLIIADYLFDNNNNQYVGPGAILREYYLFLLASLY